MFKKTANLIRSYLAKQAQAVSAAKQFQQLFNKAKAQIPSLKLPTQSAAGIKINPLKSVEPIAIPPVAPMKLV